MSDHLGRDKTYSAVSQFYWYPKLYKWVSVYVSTCKTCQMMENSTHWAAPLASVPIPSGCWESISMNFLFKLPKEAHGNAGIVVFVDRLSKMAYLAAVPDTIDGEGTSMLLFDRVFRQHGLPLAIISYRDSRFTVNIGRPSSRCLANDWTCPQRIIRRPMVKPSERIASLMTYYAAFARMNQSDGARCSQSLSLR